MTQKSEIILSIDIGGSSIKVATHDSSGKTIDDFKKVETPIPATHTAIMAAIQQLVTGLQFDKIAAGFPGYVRNGVIFTAPNLGTDDWKGIDLAKELSDAFGKPARVVNDADMLGLGIASGKGFEMVVTLGTGFGTAFFYNGQLLPHLEVAHHPLKKGVDYDQYIGKAALKEIGVERWNKRMQYVLEITKTVFNYDTLYIGGGSARKLTIPLAENIKLFTNQDGIDGGVKLWQQKESV